MKFLAIVTILGLICGNIAQLSPRATVCGQTNFVPKAASFIVGGADAAVGGLPWQVAFVQSGFVSCGGSLVTNSLGRINVITAAHCIGSTKPARYTIAFGMHDVREPTSNYVKLTPTNIVVHENYKSTTLENDIAILEFGNNDLSALAGTFAAPVCLPTRGHMDRESSVVSGWGTTHYQGSSSPVLQYVRKPMLSNEECRKTNYGATEITDSMLCSGETGKDACQGDSGGPLVANRSHTWELVGVVSWGYGCGDEGYPGVYANVYNLMDWINSKLGF